MTPEQTVRRRRILDLSQAIPPAYTEWIGRQLMAHLELDKTTGPVVEGLR